MNRQTLAIIAIIATGSILSGLAYGVTNGSIIVGDLTITDPSWLAMYTKTSATIKFLVPLIPSIGILILVIKVLMTASVRGSD